MPRIACELEAWNGHLREQPVVDPQNDPKDA
jgi:hypothetical protein